MLKVRVQCCPTCGRPLRSVINGVASEVVPIEGIHLSFAHYLRGFQGPAERTRFHREVCAPCADLLRESLEPAIRLIHEREIGR